MTTLMRWGGLVVFFWSLSWIHGSLSLAQSLSVTHRQDQPGGKVAFTVLVNRAPNAVEAFGLDVVYDPRVLQYTHTFQAEELAQGFSFFDAHEAVPGRVRVAGFTTTNQVQANSSGRFVTLEFTVVSPGSTTVALTNLVDGMAGWPAQPGRFEDTSTPPAAQQQPPAVQSAAVQVQGGVGQPSAPSGQNTAPSVVPQQPGSVTQDLAAQPPASPPAPVGTPTAAPPPQEPAPPVQSLQAGQTPSLGTSTRRQDARAAAEPSPVPIVVPTPAAPGQRPAEITAPGRTAPPPAGPVAGGAQTVVGGEAPAGGALRAATGAGRDTGQVSQTAGTQSSDMRARAPDDGASQRETGTSSSPPQQTALLISPGGTSPAPGAAPSGTALTTAPGVGTRSPGAEPAVLAPSGGFSQGVHVAVIAIAVVVLGGVVVALMKGRGNG